MGADRSVDECGGNNQEKNNKVVVEHRATKARPLSCLCLFFSFFFILFYLPVFFSASLDYSFEKGNEIGSMGQIN